MASDDGSGSHPPGKKEERASAAAAGAGFDDLEDRRFQCCVCLDLLYKPVVIACGHMSCFWCVQRAMHSLRESHCAVCRQPYNHFPSICQLLHHLLLKLEPVEYKRREKEVLEGETRVDMYSPQIIEFLNSTNNNCENEKDGENRLEDSKTGPPEEVSTDGDIINEHSKKVKLEDVSCPLCKELLYQPAVLNCGHVNCMSCLLSLDDDALKCQVCGSLHPGGFPNVCLDLSHFLEEYFPAEYESRREKVEFKKSQRNLEGSSSESRSRPSKRDTCVPQVPQDDDFFNVHIGVGCDSCGVYPIKGKRYKCKDCSELIGFDLCEVCYNTKSKLPGRFNQQHTPDHKMELDDTALLRRVMRLRGIPREGPEGMIGAFAAPVVMVPIVADDHDMEDNDEEYQLL